MVKTRPRTSFAVARHVDPIPGQRYRFIYQPRFQSLTLCAWHEEQFCCCSLSCNLVHCAPARLQIVFARHHEM